MGVKTTLTKVMGKRLVLDLFRIHGLLKPPTRGTILRPDMREREGGFIPMKEERITFGHVSQLTTEPGPRLGSSAREYLETRALEDLIEIILNELFINGFGQEADRLVLTTKEGRDLGGWCRKAVHDRLLAILKGRCR